MPPSYVRVVFMGAALLQAAPPKDELAALAGQWRGTGQILANWTSQHDLAVNINIAPDGRVSGSIGDAGIISGLVSINRAITKPFIHSHYKISMKLDGPVLRRDGVVRKRYSLYVDLSGAYLAGWGSSEGNESLPGASRKSRIRSARLGVTKLVLERSCCTQSSGER